MAVFQNKSTEIGDIIYIKTSVPILGLIALQSWVDSTVNENTDQFFIKKFRYSVDGVNYSAWQELTNANLQSVQVQSNDTFFVEYNYQRSGTLVTSDLEFNQVTINGDYVDNVDGPVYNNTYFKDFFDLNNLCSIAWSINVLEKLYKKGLLPKYLERDFNSTNADDRDFLDYWRAVTHYFALFVCLAREFQYFYQKPNVLLEYLVERGYFICEDEEYTQLLNLMSTFYSEIRQRGNRNVFLNKSYELPNGNLKGVDGEFLRLICYTDLDEFIFNLNKNSHIGFNLGGSSPMYKGLTGRLNTNKYYCDFIDDIYTLNELSINPSYLPFTSIVKDFTLNDESLSVSESSSNSGSIPINESAKVIELSNPTIGNFSGIGNGDKKIIINPNLDYQITFEIKSIGNAPTKPNFSFGVKCWDKNNNPLSTQSIIDLSSTDSFVENKELNQAGKYYFVRGVLYNKNTFKSYLNNKEYQKDNVVLYLTNYYRAIRSEVPVGYDPVSQPTYWQQLSTSEMNTALYLNIGGGNNLLLNDDIVKIDPFIISNYVSGNNNNFYIYNIRVQPLSTDYSKGFLNSTNLIELWGTNNNLALSEVKVKNFTRKYLVPMNTFVKHTFINTEINR